MKTRWEQLNTRFIFGDVISDFAGRSPHVVSHRAPGGCLGEASREAGTGSRALWSRADFTLLSDSGPPIGRDSNGHHFGPAHKPPVAAMTDRSPPPKPPAPLGRQTTHSPAEILTPT